jgi:FkbM family methyltransferase
MTPEPAVPTRQRLLRRLLSLPVVRNPARAMLRSSVWTVEKGLGAGLKLRFPQNLSYATGDSEVPVQQEIARRLKPGDVFYDIGANMGFFSLIAGRLAGPTGQVCAFEPHPRNASMVADNARLNGMAQMQVFPVAIGNSARRDVLQMTDWDGGGALAGYAVGPDESITRTEVQVLPLDVLIAEKALPLPTFVKIDVEGAEMEVIDGMADTIARCRPVLLYEIDDGDPNEFRRRWAELDARVSALGYRVRHLENAYPDTNWNVGHSVAEPVAAPPSNE